MHAGKRLRKNCALRRAVSSLICPNRRTPTNSQILFFDSMRDYVEQMNCYKAFQGRPIGRVPHGAKKAARAARLVRSRR